MKDNLAMESARRTLHDDQVRDLVRKAMQEQREQRALRWFLVIWMLGVAGLGWLAFTPSGRAFLRWVDGAGR